MKKLIKLISFCTISVLLTSCGSANPIVSTRNLLLKKKWQPDFVQLYDQNGNVIKEQAIKYDKKCSGVIINFLDSGVATYSNSSLLNNQCNTNTFNGTWSLNNYILSQTYPNHSDKDLSAYITSITNVYMILEVNVLDSERGSLPAGAKKYRYYYKSK